MSQNNAKPKVVRGPGGRGGHGPAKMSKNSLKTLKRLLIYILKEYKFLFSMVIITIIISSLANVYGTTFIKDLIDKYITPLLGQSSPDFGPLLEMMAMMAFVYYVGVIATYAYSRMMMYISQGSLKRIRDDMFSHMEALPVKFFDTHAHGDVMSLYTNDTDALRQMISQGVPQLLSAIITVIGVLIAMIRLSLPLIVVEALIILLMFKVTKTIGAKSGKYFGLQQKDLGAVNGYIEEMMEGQKVVKVFCHEEEAKINFDKLNDELCNSANNANKYANVLMPIMGNIGYINYVSVAIVGSILAINSFWGFTLGALATFLQLTRTFSQTVNQMSQQFNFVIMALAGAERIFTLLDEKKEMDEGYVTLVNANEDENGNLTEAKKRTGIWAWKHPHEDGTTTYSKLNGEVVFDDVDFGYNDEKIILHNIKLYAKPGQKIAFVGATGAGKTTITNLINRFYDIQDGKIRYDGININKIKKDDLRSSLGIVLQDAHLFTGTVADNIRYGKLDATDEEVHAAAKLANADQFIKHLPKGYDTVLTGDGGSLSQGQRQLLTIARAAIADPPVLILDEATSSIDTRTEKIVQDGMDKLMNGRTVFVIAHRLSTIKNSDVIMVLDQGRIIERGNHDDLIEEKGKYYQLYTGAFELS
ncbi:ABC transporter ATP-binding protein [Clostridium saccharoperbutylacetonicum]|uniref:ABC-type multidrug transport system, ATPase and permease components n=2 Tax=Clostridium TaxID=1485 RepID=M1MND2_9CLOT|nr:ABC transporter ATP-binding protein [Clostridium saccharoperbutylacetonicum]AGF59389.1 ABC-type multidrug transport system, ATPase and permease components [Clostridium saccharoperbutylacetonicum N1-4(HMT)]NRT59820.1 ATP-binding cassette subfamily B protein [Clostridium saccharoperbutylacetonicum]NSB23132.1 ATP-binding cassette subfamily B protein [Clostridium saccharoperbutylacetonicum]NSB42503.1 ATP-binding cassette subfamily B protein [Clostridium saccharoperbutylacetonicum]